MSRAMEPRQTALPVTLSALPRQVASRTDRLAVEHALTETLAHFSGLDSVSALTFMAMYSKATLPL